MNYYDSDGHKLHKEFQGEINRLLARAEQADSHLPTRPPGLTNGDKDEQEKSSQQSDVRR